MRKLLALMLLVFITTCAAAETRTIDLQTMTLDELEALRSEIDAAIIALQEPEEEAVESKPDSAQLAVGDTVTLGNVDLTLESFGFAEEIVEETMNVTFADSRENSRIVYVRGITKDGYEEFSELGNHVIFEFVVDDQYEIRANLISNQEMYIAMGYEPKSASSFWIYGDIHNDLVQDYDSLVLRIGYRESYTYEDSQAGLNFENCDVVYELDMTPDALTEYTDKATVKNVQAAMNELGYECGTPDGLSGKKTQTAIQAFQHDNNLTETGTVTHETLQALRAMGMSV